MKGVAVLKFSPGDWIALVIGLTVGARWVWDTIGHWLERSTDIESAEHGKLVQLLSDLRSHEAQDRTEFTWIKESLGRVERKMDNLQRQMSFVSIGQNNKLFHSEDDNEPK